MRRYLQYILVIAITGAMFGAIELYYRVRYPEKPSFPDHNGLWQRFQAYAMVATAPGTYTRWHNTLTGQTYSANVVTNSLGFNEPRELSYTKPYKRAQNERVVLFTSGSAGWGVGTTSTEKTITGRMQFHLNNLQRDIKYTVVNLAMGSWIAYQEYIALQLWGEAFKPDWIVVMDGHNDAGVSCGFSQGIGNPMYFAAVQSYVQGYLYSTHNPVFYRGWFENQLIKYSATYRTLTGREYVPNRAQFDQSSTDARGAARHIIPTKMGESRDVLDFYLKSQRAILNLYPNAGYILSTQPLVNQFTGDFVDIYQFPAGSEQRQAAIAKRTETLEQYLTQYENQWCSQKTYAPSFTYIFGNGAVRLERLVEESRASGRKVEYHNIGLLFSDERPKRIPYFIDAVHLSDEGNDAIGKFYAERILRADTAHQ